MFQMCRRVGMADEADTKSVVGNHVRVQVPLPAVKHSNPNLLPIGETFGFVVFLKDVNMLVAREQTTTLINAYMDRFMAKVASLYFASLNCRRYSEGVILKCDLKHRVK